MDRAGRGVFCSPPLPLLGKEGRLHSNGYGNDYGNDYGNGYCNDYGNNNSNGYGNNNSNDYGTRHTGCYCNCYDRAGRCGRFSGTLPNPTHPFNSLARLAPCV
ncbi:MAG: hypothetical protein HS116_20360 [Planctomycetes bacterium]|nr:hypothetical protein [Planctomycetota bacterium]